MRRLSLSFAFLAFLLLVPATRVHAFDDWLPITEEDKKITAETEKGADAIILYHEETSDDNTGHLYAYKRLKILTEKGKARANVEIPYEASFAGISELKARTIGPDGTITTFSGKILDKTKIKGRGIKEHVKSFTLPNVQVGSIVEWKYTEYWNRFVFSPHWAVQEDLAQKRAKFAFLAFYKGNYYVTDARGDMKDHLYYSFTGLPESTALKTIGSNRMELELKDIPAFEEEDFAPPSAVLKMRVDFYYGTLKMAKPEDFWKEEGKYWSREVDQFIGSPSGVSSIVGQVVTPSDSPEQRVRKIYAYVQKLKNLSYEIGESRIEELLDRDKEKHTSETILHKGEGHRDEITRCFIALVRAAGIQAFAMRVADRDRHVFQANVPNAAQLDSEIAIVVLNGKEVFLDPGTPLCPYGLLRWQHASTRGLRQTASGAEMAGTPAANYKDAISKRVARLTLSPDGSAHGQLAIGWTGVEALDHRLSVYRTDEVGKKKELEEEVQKMMPPGAAVELLQSNNWDNPDAQLSATFNVNIPSYASTTGKRLVVPSYLFQGARTQPFTGTQRKHPVYFNFPFYTIDDVQFTLPSGLKAENIPQTAPVRTDYSMYKVQRSVNGNTISVARDFAMAGIGFKQTDYPELRKFFDGVTTGDSEPVVLTSVQ